MQRNRSEGEDGRGSAFNQQKGFLMSLSKFSRKLCIRLEGIGPSWPVPQHWRMYCLVLILAVVSQMAAGLPERPRTFANPINIDYRFMPDSPSRREAADPVIVLFGDDYYLFASKSGGYWHSTDMIEWKFVKPEGLPIEAYEQNSIGKVPPAKIISIVEAVVRRTP